MGILGWESTTNLRLIQIIGGWSSLDKHDMSKGDEWGRGK